MHTGFCRFNVGLFECIALSDGSFTYPSPGPFLFANAPFEGLRAKLHAYHIQPEQWTEWTSPYTCIAVDTGTHRALIDTGGGSLSPDTGRLLQNLHAVGIEPAEIDVIVITHAHPDHLGGNTGTNGEPIFPNARFVIHRDEWDFWMGMPDLRALQTEDFVKRLLVNTARAKLGAIEGQVELINREKEILPGIRALAAPGHTPGHMALAIYSNDKQLLCLSDTVLHPIHLESPEWYAAVDLDPEQTVITRHRLLATAANQKSLVHAYHFPFPALGHIVAKGDEWQWRSWKAK